jgi:hypothetical protein
VDLQLDRDDPEALDEAFPTADAPGPLPVY